MLHSVGSNVMSVEGEGGLDSQGSGIVNIILRANAHILPANDTKRFGQSSCWQSRNTVLQENYEKEKTPCIMIFFA